MEGVCSGLNRIFDKIYVINLERRPDRLIKALWQLDQIQTSVQVVTAVDGQSPEIISEYEQLKQNPIYFQRQLTEGRRLLSSSEYSYLKTWAQILRSAERDRHEWILCLDDDVVFPGSEQWETRFEHSKLVQMICGDTFGLIWLGASQHQSDAIDWESAAENGFYHPVRTDGSFAIAVNRKLFPDLLQAIERYEAPFDSGALSECASIPESSRVGVSSAVLYPNLVIADLTESDIRAGRCQEEMAKKFHWNLRDQLYQYPVDSHLPWISVIVPVYNAEATIQTSLASLVKQTYDRLEIIVVDDASTDQSWGLIQEFRDLHLARDYPKFQGKLKLYQNAQQSGCYASRNVGLSHATGELIAFQDADDISLCYRLEQQLVYLLKYSVLWTQCLVLRTHLDTLSLDSEQLEEQIESTRIHYIKNTEGKTRVPDDMRQYEYCCSGILGMVTGLYRRAVFDRLGQFLDLPCWADAEFCERILARYAGIYFPVGDNIDTTRTTEVDLPENNGNVISYLRDTGHLPGLFYKVNQIMYLSHQMTGNNITNQYPLQQKLYYQNQWRESLKNDNHDHNIA